MTSHLRRLVGSAVLLAGLAIPAAAAAQMTPDERTRLRDYLTTMRDQVISDSNGLTPEQWTFKPGPDRWSVADVVQHLTLSEPFIFGMHQKTMKDPAATAERRAATQGKDAVILKALPDRTQRFQAPEPLRPVGAPVDRDAGLAAFKAARATTLDYVQTTQGDVRAHVADLPIGPVDGYQVLLFLAAHNERHLAQLREVKADPGFPKRAGSE
jgi:hypothetical protein